MPFKNSKVGRISRWRTSNARAMKKMGLVRGWSQRTRGRRRFF